LRGWPALSWVLTNEAGALSPEADAPTAVPTDAPESLWKIRIMRLLRNF